jgi:hypothetical protein
LTEGLSAIAVAILCQTSGLQCDALGKKAEFVECCFIKLIPSSCGTAITNASRLVFRNRTARALASTRPEWPKMRVEVDANLSRVLEADTATPANVHYEDTDGVVVTKQLKLLTVVVTAVPDVEFDEEFDDDEDDEEDDEEFDDEDDEDDEEDEEDEEDDKRTLKYEEEFGREVKEFKTLLFGRQKRHTGQAFTAAKFKKSEFSIDYQQGLLTLSLLQEVATNEAVYVEYKDNGFNHGPFPIRCGTLSLPFGETTVRYRRKFRNGSFDVTITCESH